MTHTPDPSRASRPCDSSAALASRAAFRAYAVDRRMGVLAAQRYLARPEGFRDCGDGPLTFVAAAGFVALALVGTFICGGAA